MTKKKVFRNILSISLALFLALGAIPFSGIDLPDFSGINAFAADEESPTSGTCGENLTWTFDTETGTLTISGEGEMENYYYSEWNNKIKWDAPWKSHRLSIKKLVVEDGVTKIGYDAFTGCENLSEFSLADSVVSIDHDAFEGCSALTNIVIPDTVTYVDGGEIGNQATVEYVRIPMTEELGYYFDDNKKSASEITITEKEIIFKWSDDTQRTVINIGSGVNLDQLFCILGATGYVEKINLDENNENFKLIDGVLYDKNVETLIIYPTASDKKTYVMPDTVKTDLGIYMRHLSCFGALHLENLTLGKNFLVDEFSDLLKEAKEFSKMLTDSDIAQAATEEQRKLAELNFLGYGLSNCMSQCTTMVPMYGYRTIKNFTVSEDHPYFKSENGFLCYNTEGQNVYIHQIVDKTDKIEFTENDFFFFMPYQNIRIDETVLSDGFIENRVKALDAMSVIIGIAEEKTGEKLDICRASTLSSSLMGICTGKFSVSDANEYLSVEDGVLFNKDKTILLQYPIASERKFYEIPKVKYISCYAFSSAYEAGFLKNPDLTIHIPQSVADGTTGFILDDIYSQEKASWALNLISYSVGGFCFENEKTFNTIFGEDFSEYKAKIDAYNADVAEAYKNHEESLNSGTISEKKYILERAQYEYGWILGAATPDICGSKHNIIETFIIDEPENTEVKFDETLTLTANLGEAGLPEGCKVEWSVDGTGAEITVSEDTLSCTVKCVDSGEVTVTATVVDTEDNTVTDEYGNDAVASQTLTMNASFFVRVEAFFKYLWNLIVSLFK